MNNSRSILLSVFCISLVIPSFLSVIASEKKNLWVYTSIYKEYIGPIELAFEKQNPDIDVQVFQGGSEKIQAKVEAEFMSGHVVADVVLTSDPFWMESFRSRGLTYEKTGTTSVVTNYYSLMVMIANKSLTLEKRPKSFSDLTKPDFKNLTQAGSPLESGTMFSTVAYLSQKYGWTFFEQLRANGLASNGGNSTVIQKVESGEKKVGICLLENALSAIKRGSPIEVIYPEDGSVPIPSVQAIMKSAVDKGNAEKFAQFILSKEAQMLIRTGNMYSIRSDVPAPDGALAFKEVTKKSTLWTPELIKKISVEGANIKKKYSSIVLDQ